MRKPRTWFTAAVAASLTVAAGLAPQPALAEDDCSAGKVLNIVAHHDDDLLFLSPDLIHDIQEGKCVQTLFLIASNYPGNPPRPISDTEYMQERERGVRDAYATAAGEDPGNWTSQHYQADQKEATQWTLNERVSIVELRIPDNSTPPGNSLWWLYALDQPVTTVDNEENGPQTFTRRELGDFLRRIVANFRPDEIHAGDPLADHRTTGYHEDHMATARLVRWSLEDWAGAPPIRYYRDYSIVDEPSNLPQQDIDVKTDVFTAFVRHDWDICKSGGECPPEEWENTLYPNSMSRQYQVDQNWREGYIEPLPEPYGDNGREDLPYIRGHYKIVNVATGGELAVYNASLDNGARLTTWRPTGTPNQTFELRAHQGGWEISPLHSKDPGTDRWKCLDVPGHSTDSGMEVDQFDCGGWGRNPDEGPRDYFHQTLRIIKQPAGDYELVFRHSDLRLTAPPNDGGTVIQASWQANDNYQKWILVKA